MDGKMSKHKKKQFKYHIFLKSSLHANIHENLQFWEYADFYPVLVYI